MPEKTDKPMLPINIAFPPDLLEEVDRMAEHAGISRSSLVRNMIRECIPKYRRTLVLLDTPALRRVILAMARADADDADEQMRIAEVEEHFRARDADRRSVAYKRSQSE